MRVHVINRDRHTDRWARCERLNGGVVDLVRFPAVDGRTVDRADLITQGFLIEPCTRTDQEMGSALSHCALWQQAVDSDETLTVIEDDTVLAGNFAAVARRMLSELPTDWDIIMWGWDPSEHLWAEIPEGVSVCRLEFHQAEMRKHIEVFRAGCRSHTAVRLRHCMGTPAYTITPAGARTMLDACLPMTDREVVVSCGGAVMNNPMIDADMNRVFPESRAYACLPPVAMREGERNRLPLR